MNEWSTVYLGNKEIMISYTKSSGQSMKVFGSYKEDNSEEYKSFIINKLQEKIKQSRFYGTNS